MLQRIRGALGRGALDGAEAGRLRAQLADPPANRTPAGSRGSPETLLRRFVAKLRGVSASVDGVAALAELPVALERYLAADGLPRRIRVAPHPELLGLPWSTAGLEAGYGPAGDADAVGVSRAYAGVAESGTLLLCSGPESPTTLNFLPDTHVVVLATSELEGSYEAVWRRLRAAGEPRAFLPRTVNWITGPSRTADIEQTLQMGIHGPRRLHVVLVGEGLQEACAEA
ncbi:MAG TPA: LUD domain-containing protein [Gammaproteobacteria bacterium]